MIRDLSVFKVGEINKCETCNMGWANSTNWINDRGHLMEEITSCRDGCPAYKPPHILVPDDYEVYKIRKNVYGLRPICHSL